MWGGFKQLYLYYIHVVNYVLLLTWGGGGGVICCSLRFFFSLKSRRSSFTTVTFRAVVVSLFTSVRVYLYGTASYGPKLNYFAAPVRLFGALSSPFTSKAVGSAIRFCFAVSLLQLLWRRCAAPYCCYRKVRLRARLLPGRAITKTNVKVNTGHVHSGHP